MKRFLIFSILYFVAAGVALSAQTKAAFSPDKTRELGFNVSFLVQEFFGTLEVNDLPKNTIFQLKYANKGQKWVKRVGLGGGLLFNYEPSTANYGFDTHLRLGLERRLRLHEKWNFLVGSDALGEVNYYTDMQEFSSGTVRTTELIWRAGPAPFWGVMYRPFERFCLSLESSLTLAYRQRTSLTDNISTEDVLLKDASLQMRYDYPLNIYATFRF